MIKSIHFNPEIAPEFKTYIYDKVMDYGLFPVVSDDGKSVPYLEIIQVLL